MNMFMEMELRWRIEVKKTSVESVLTAKYGNFPQRQLEYSDCRL